MAPAGMLVFYGKKGPSAGGQGGDGGRVVLPRLSPPVASSGNSWELPLQTSLLGTLGPQEPHRGWRSWGGAVTAKLLPHHPATMHPHEGKAKAPCPNCKGGALFSPEAGSTWPPHRERRDSTESGRRAEGTVPREPQSRCA
ncbi:unnamed protein product [Rangifer tarandus platyrhynchus]|uniref:Uncharacterized protein n=1 Tax=Rangifer tarandus platyrhynchus TaxID=3082113 RepID=A0AC59ZPP9_RANTA